jgi:hypothetical protein
MEGGRMTAESTRIAVRYDKDLTAVEAEHLVVDLARAAGKPVWIMAQSFEKREFGAWSGSIQDFERTFAGRIFGPVGEVRWAREVDHYHVWWISEEMSGLAVRKIERRHYLWGYFENGRWAEGRIPQELFYPVPAGKEKDREFIRVAEYLPELEVPPDSRDAWEDMLNQPSIAAHRFVSVGAGANKANGDEA